MAVDFALFLSPEGIALAHRQRDGHWALIGETGLDVPDLGASLTGLRALGEDRGGPDFPALLILPDDQILYTEMAVDAGADDAFAQVGRGLDGRTPYALGELAYDFRTSGPGFTQVAAVAQQTLTEAMDFARAAGFNGVGFAATPAEARYPGIPIFALEQGFSLTDTPYTGMPLGPDTWGTDDADAVVEEPEVAAEAAEDTPAEVVDPSDEAQDAASEEETHAQDDQGAPAPAPVSESGAQETGPEEPAEPEEDAVPEPEATASDAPEDDTSVEDAQESDDPVDTAEPVELDMFGEPIVAAEPDQPAADEGSEPQSEEAEADTGPGLFDWTTNEDITEETTPVQEDVAAADMVDDTPPEPEPAPVEPEPEPEPEPLEAASFDIDSAAEVTEPDIVAEVTEPAAETADAALEDTPVAAFSTSRAADADTGFPIERAVQEADRGRLQLDLEADVPTAPEPGQQAEPEDHAPEKPAAPATRQRRKARTPALFAGGGQPHDAREAWVEPIAPAPPAPEVPAPEAVAMDAPASLDSSANTANPSLPISLPPGLKDRLKKRKELGLHKPVTGFKAERPITPAPLRAEPLVPARVQGEEALMAGGVLGQRPDDAAARPSLRTALVLTVVLILILALIAVWSALFLPDSRVARMLGRVAPEVQTTEPTVPEAAATAELETAAAVPQPRPEVEVAPEPVIEEPEIALPTPPPTRVPPPSREEVLAEYAQYRIWQLAPDPPAPPARDFVIPEASDDLRLAALSPVVVGYDAVALIAPSRPVNPRAPDSPPPFGQQLTDEGLIEATPEGVTTPDGVFVILAQPEVATRPRPGPVPGEADAEVAALAPSAAGGLGDAILAAFPPTPRPDDLVAPDATDSLTEGELADRQPAPRPQSVQEAAEETAEAQEGAEEVSALAVASSILPQARPASIAAAAAASDRGPASGASTASLAQPAPTPDTSATVVPDIPSSASVSRTATVENVIDLREINLIGVRGSPDNRVALVRLPSGRFVSVSVGDRLDGGRVAAIGPDTLQYVRNGRNITLEAPEG